MDELTFRLVFGVAGLVLGLILGWTSRAAIDSRAVRKAVMTDPDATPSRYELRRRWRPSANDVVLLFLIAITLLATVSSWRTNARVDHMATCTAKVTEDFIRAVNERTSFTEESARRNLELQDAEKAMLTGVLNPNATREQRRKAVEDYAAAMNAYQHVQAKATKQRQAWPFPTQEEIDRCRT